MSNNSEKQAQIAKTILNQVEAMNPGAFDSYQSTVFGALPESRRAEGGVMFHVTGKVYTGIVVIELLWIDLYKVSTYTMNGDLIDSVSDVFCDMLAMVLEGIVNGE